MALFDWPITTQKIQSLDTPKINGFCGIPICQKLNTRPHRALSAPFLGLTVQLCVEPCGSAAGFDLLTIELVQIEKKSLLASRTANDFVQQDLVRTHAARDSGPGPSEQVAALGSTEAGGRHENNFN
jgi:hypothetical protein